MKVTTLRFSPHGAAASCGGPPAGRPPPHASIGRLYSFPSARPQTSGRETAAPRSTPLPALPTERVLAAPLRGQTQTPRALARGTRPKQNPIPRRERGPAWLGRLGAASPLGLPRGRPTPPELGTNWAKPALPTRGERFGPTRGSISDPARGSLTGLTCRSQAGTSCAEAYEGIWKE